MRTVTARELGPNLPIGFVKDGRLIKEFSVRPYKSRIDRAINIWREANQGKHIAYLVGKVVSLLVEQAGGRGYALTDEGDSTPETELEILGWHYADVFYVYLYARIVSVEQFMSVPVVCPRCSYQGILKADLWSTEVNVIDEPEEMLAWVDLRRGFTLENGKQCKRLQLRPIPFSAQIAPGAAEVGVDVLGYNQFREGIATVEGAEIGYVISDEEIDEIEKIDQLAIDRQAGKVVAGPKLRTILDCPGKDCGNKLIDGINWSFDHFFDSSVPLDILMP